MPTNPHAVCDKRPHRNTVLAQLRAMQDIAFGRVMKETTEDKDVAQLLRAYVTAEQQRNVLRMRPAPKPIDVSGLHKRKQRQAPTGPVPLEPASPVAQVPPKQAS